MAGPHQTLGSLGAQRVPIGHLWRGSTLRSPHRGTPRTGGASSAPDAEFPWLTKGEVEILGIYLAQGLKVQPWPKPWQRRKIIRKYLGKMSPPAGTPVEQRFTSTSSIRWQGPVMTKTQKRRMQRLEANACNSGVTTRRPRLNPRREWPVHRLPVTPRRLYNEAGESTMPP